MEYIYIISAVITWIFIFTPVNCESCRFFQGSNSFQRTCSTGCCDNVCCSDDYKTLAIILGTVFGCLLLIIVVVVIVICLTRERWSKRVGPRKDGKSVKEDEIILQDMTPRPSISA